MKRVHAIFLLARRAQAPTGQTVWRHRGDGARRTFGGKDGTVVKSGGN